MSYNRLILLGNLTRDPELQTLSSGTALCKCAIACNRKWKDSQGEMQEDVLFLDFTVWGRSAEVFSEYMAKGRQVHLEGRLQLEKWEDKDGNPRSKHTMVVEKFTFCGGQPEREESGRRPAQRSQGGGKSRPAQSKPQQRQATRQPAKPPPAEDYTTPDEDIPF